MMRQQFLIPVLFSLAFCGISDASSTVNPAINETDNEDLDSIIGGSPAAAGEFPFMASLTINRAHFCGGTLIGPSHVLTAAHCCTGYFSAADTSSLKVTVNSLLLGAGSAGAVTRQVRKFVLHGSYDSNTMENDIALLALTAPIDNVLPTYIPRPWKPSGGTGAFLYSRPPAIYGNMANKPAIILGWGNTKPGGPSSNVLLKATVKVLEDKVCSRQYSAFNIFGIPFFSKFYADQMLCAAAAGTDTCQGDSGGPLMVDKIGQVGITSFGRGCANPQYAGVYTRIAHHLSWIADTRAKM